MTLEIRKPADRRFAKGLFFSPAGHGKTHLLGTAQEDERTSPMLLMDFEGGHETLAGLDIDVAEIRSWDDYNEAYELLTSDTKEPYRSIGLDSASETHIWALLTRLDEQAPQRKDPDLIEIGDYGIAGTQLRRLLREFRDLPQHVFFTAGSKEITERGVGRVKIPSLAGQMAEEIVHIMSIVGYLAMAMNEETGEPERLLILQNYIGYRTKVRAPWKSKAPDDLVNPTITDLLDALNFQAIGASTNGQPPRAARPPRQARQRLATPTAVTVSTSTGTKAKEDEDSNG